MVSVLRVDIMVFRQSWTARLPHRGTFRRLELFAPRGPDLLVGAPRCEGRCVLGHGDGGGGPLVRRPRFLLVTCSQIGPITEYVPYVSRCPANDLIACVNTLEPSAELFGQSVETREPAATIRFSCPGWSAGQAPHRPSSSSSQRLVMQKG